MSNVILCKVPKSEKCPSGIRIVVPGTKATIEDAMRTIPRDAREHVVVDRSRVPEDRYFRDAWSLGSSSNVEVDMNEARRVHIDKLREERNETLAKLDVKFMRALESGDMAEQQRISAKKQKLRDMPQDLAFQNINTPEELKAFVPDYIGGE